MPTTGALPIAQKMMSQKYQNSSLNGWTTVTLRDFTPFSKGTMSTQSGTYTSVSQPESLTTATINGGKKAAREQVSKSPLSTYTTITTCSDSSADIAPKLHLETDNCSEGRASQMSSLSGEKSSMNEGCGDNALKTLLMNLESSTKTSLTQLSDINKQSSESSAKRKQLLALWKTDGPSAKVSKTRKRCINNCTSIDNDTGRPCVEVYDCCPWAGGCPNCYGFE